MSKELKKFSVNDVAAHKDTEAGIYIIIDGNVYDVTGIWSSACNALIMHLYLCNVGFINEHLGGAKILKRVAGKDVSKQFWKVSVARL